MHVQAPDLRVQPLHTPSRLHEALAFSKDGSRLLVASGTASRITLWDIQAGSQAGSILVDIAPNATFLGGYDGGDRAENIAFSSTERFFVTDATMGAISSQRRSRSASQG
ncbi:uncharacterized protein PHACADRAFT_198805 [Phanerochaete carnosa HHB-10118-sp]|uniref:Uncharacterized protein n=1 Tax=Phanerochaete carnosa (strain HHB-10118-sp) TaxID=650164 RepID=K5W1J2_PHACS|nr:uncharacterized protein PHACADRAFT_198805 [Phanerochaete carnosa HHB-10118-sp]EKM52759.1 hypothetical protein PHACADRAFT_198805 [Phanerochaete carnosa HHB-10118-sp]